ncbi:peroxidasin homolog [Dysidea avara]|uniref:peroxidasin homolog n=1 Tax=Dysidea avara TaxID=196820 RepID=UPI003320EF49
MTGNDLTEIIPGNFTRYSQLEELYLNDNTIASIGNDDFSEGLSQLLLLSLDGNPLWNISDRAFSNLTALQNLTIRNTPLSTVQADAFLGLSHLQYLTLDGSDIEELPADVFTHIGQTPLVSVKGTQLTHLPEGIFSTVNTSSFNIDLSNNIWECDCMSVPLRDYLTANPNILVTDVICVWPLESRGVSITVVTEMNVTFTCYAPSILTHPQNTSVLTGDSITLNCNITALPRPEVTWSRDNQSIEYDQRVQLLEDGSLLISDVMLDDVGVYQCVISNINGSDSSYFGELNVTEATCFDNIQSPHETDVDCGGEFCSPCNITQMCVNNSDCLGDLVCLYTYQLPSTLDYISSRAPLANTCNIMELASQLLEDRIMESTPDVLGLNITFDGNITDIQDQMKQALADQFEVDVSTILTTNIVTIPRTQTPLIQVYFSVPHTNDGDRIVSLLREQVHNGDLSGTLKITDSGNQYDIRINV